MSVASTSTSTPTPVAEPVRPRQRFTSYVHDVLATTLAQSELHSGGRRLRVRGFRLREASANGPVIPIVREDAAANDLLAAHLHALLTLTAPEFSCGAGEWTCAWKHDPGAAHRFTSGVTPGDDFVFSYPVDASPQAARTLAEYVAELTSGLLDVVDLVGDGASNVVPDAVSINGAAAALRRIAPYDTVSWGARAEGPDGSGHRQPLHSVIATEPAIAALGRHWQLLRAAAGFRGDAGPLDLQGFRLLRGEDWVIPTAGHPAEVYEYLARVCNVSCAFCYLYGNPSSMAIARGKKVVSRNEIETRLRYFDAEGRRALFRAQWEINEFLVDPKLPDVLRELRRRTSQAFFFVTNGSPLIPRVIDLLAEVQPVELIVSINSIDQDLRAGVMHENERQTLTAMACFERLAERKIPFGISLAAFPAFPLESLERTVRAVEALGAAFVRVNLPGFTAEMPYRAAEDLDRHWFRVVEWVRELRKSVSIPVITIPSAFEESWFHERASEPRVLGVVPNSPAVTSGLRPGDVVRKVGGFQVGTRAQAIAMMLLIRKPTPILVEREGRPQECTLDPGAPGGYPYRSHQTGKYTFPNGVVMAPSLSGGHARQIAAHLSATRAERAWILTSSLMHKAATELIESELPDYAGRLDLVTTRNEYLGGNIRVMDMCTVGDLARAVEDRLTRAPAPDLILVPSSGFNFQGRDIAGRHWGDLERWLGIHVRTIEIAQFLF